MQLMVDLKEEAPANRQGKPVNPVDQRGLRPKVPTGGLEKPPTTVSHWTLNQRVYHIPPGGRRSNCIERLRMPQFLTRAHACHSRRNPLALLGRFGGAGDSNLLVPRS